MRGIRNRVGRTGACRISGHDCARRVVHVAGSETAAAACSRCGINLRVGLLLNELPFIALYYLLVSTLLAFGQGDIDSPGAWSVVGLAVVTAAGLAVVIRREARADPAAAHAFRAGLGTSLPHRRLPWARILFAPLFMRRPFLVAYGDHDTVVCMEGARSFVAGLRSASTHPVVYLELTGAQHAFDLFHSIRFERVVDAVGALTAWVTRAREEAVPRS